MRFRFLFCAVSALAAQPALSAPPAAPPPPATPVEPATLAAADRFLTAMDYDGMMRRACDAMVAQFGPMLKSSIERKTGEPVDDALIGRISDIQSQYLRETLLNTPGRRRATATIYATHFTARELDRLAELYRDPVMRRWSEVSPVATAELMPLIHDVAEAHRAELEEKIKAAVVDYYSKRKATPDS